MLNSTVFRIAVRVLAVLGVFSTLVHILAIIVIFFTDFPGWGDQGLFEGEEAAFNRRMASEPRTPKWFPEGDRIAFSHAGGVYVIDSTGTHLELIDGGGDELDLAFAPSVSPDGSRIAYTAYEQSGWLPWDKTESWDIVTAKPDGSDRHMLTENNQLDINPFWSRDGTGIFSVSAPERGTAFRGIRVTSADDSGTFPEAKYVYPKVNHPVSGTPVLSPKGSHIAFLVDRLQSGNELYVIKTDGSGLTRIDAETSLPTWSPSGQHIAYAKRVVGNAGYTPVGIYTTTLDGSESREIISFPTQSLAWIDSISWSPDGSEILFGSYVITADGSAVTRELPWPGAHSYWSPDGSRIAVYSGDVSSVVIYTLAADGSDARVLVEETADGLVPANGRPLP